MAYVFDANTLIEAKNRYYPFDVCPGFWDWLLLERDRGNVFSINAVKAELKDPESKRWGKDHPDFFITDDDSRMREVTAWVVAQNRFKVGAVKTFLDHADPRLISFALVHGHTIVTQEVSAPESKNKVKIPDVCAALGVPCRNSMDVLKELRARFVLDTRQ